METKKKHDSGMQQFLSRRNFAFGLTATGAYLTGCKSGVAAAKVKMPGAPSPPMALAAPEKFGAVRSDPYDWLRNREDPRVVAYLNEENTYADALLKPVKPLLDELTAELQERATPADASVPTAYNGYVYQRRFVRGSQYPVIVRWKDVTESSEEEVVLDVGALSAGHQRQYHLGSWTVGPDNRLVAFTVDFNGDGQFRVFVRTLSTGKVDDHGMRNAGSSLVRGRQPKLILCSQRPDNSSCFSGLAT